MRLVLDASVVVKWFVLEELHDEALRLLDSRLERYAPSLLGVEVASTLWKKVRRREMRRDAAEDALADLDAMPLRSIACASLLPSAFALAVDLDHPIYDCFYVALAKELPATLVTADGRLRRRLEASRIGPDLLDLAAVEARLG